MNNNFAIMMLKVKPVTVLAKHEASFAGARMRTDKIDANVGAIAIVLHTLVNVVA